MSLRLAAGLVVAILLATSLAEAQRGFRGGRGRFGSESGAPPRFASQADFDGKFHICRLMYTQVRQQNLGMGWGTDYPFAEINLSIRLSELTKTTVAFDGERNPVNLVVRPTDDALFQCPVVIASDPGSAGFSAADADRLREYLDKGGFLWVDDFWGSYAWDSFASEIGKVLPPGEFPIKDLEPGHAIFRTLFPVAEIPQVPSLNFWRGSGGETSEMGIESEKAHMAAITDKRGRIMVLMTHNTDIADSWEREGDDPNFFFHFSPNGYAVGLNTMLYAMTH
ncbi:MAG: DUF4159 domain-containing protein [Acidobacteriota bacterium]|nr:DUF4159 domain-containing protein [Acidobacteriota bacterium]